MNITLENLTKRFPARGRKAQGEVTAVEDLTFEIPDGMLVGLLGPSGCGKSTTLNMICGLETPTSGKIFFGEEDVTALAPELRGVGMVFQNYALYPHLTVMQNILFPLENLKGKERPSRQEMRRRALETAKLVQIEELLERKPRELSGGQQQRVALARALVLEPSVLLFDEPLSNLDAKLRVSMRTEIRRIQQKTGITAVYVTHDQSEAMALSDRIIIMNKGVVAQMGTPQEIYYHPNSEFVADFIGEANFLKGVCKGLDGDHALLEVAGTEVRVAAVENMKVGETYTIVLRPESAGLAPEGALQCKVVLSCFMGAYQNYHVMVGDTLVKLTDYDPKNHHIYQVGDTCALTFRPDGVHIL